MHIALPSVGQKPWRIFAEENAILIGSVMKRPMMPSEIELVDSMPLVLVRHAVIPGSDTIAMVIQATTLPRTSRSSAGVAT